MNLLGTLATAETSRHRGLVMVLSLALLLGGFLLVVLLIGMTRARRRWFGLRRSKPGDKAEVDPWFEAGRRLSVLPDSDEDDDLDEERQDDGSG